MIVSLFTLGLLLPALLIIRILKGHDISPMEVMVALMPTGLLIGVGFFKLVGVL